MPAIPCEPIEAGFAKSSLAGTHTFVYVEDPYNIRCARIVVDDDPSGNYRLLWDGVDTTDPQFLPTCWPTSHTAMQHASHLVPAWVERYYDHTESTFMDEPDEEFL